MSNKNQEELIEGIDYPYRDEAPKIELCNCHGLAQKYCPNKKIPEFTCPTCGSHHFGTYYPNHRDISSFKNIEEAKNHFNNNAIGQYNGYIRISDTQIKSCRFRWPRKDDSKYFK
jgi:hypothetical protein